mmetsp:Transcript_4156/g.6136  ORF Transcript_4156/g.6136 Transcript_4156/m.6136 type:complete len:361 (+) Transcript_4156:75-1157(+)
MGQCASYETGAKQDSTIYHMDLKDCIFVGHTNTDLDSIAGAIAASHLFGGVPARASDINTETEYVLTRWGFELPPKLTDVPEFKEKGICLVDFNQRSQLTEGLNEKQIRGIIDHHALREGSISSDIPIYMDIRPWGSVSTILAHTYLRNGKTIPKNVAGLMLSAILSDTLNRNSPTCTQIDKDMVLVLAEIAGVTDINELANQQFKAKAKMILKYSIAELLRGDLKKFQIQDILMAFGVCETPDSKTVLSKKEDILNEMRKMKATTNADLVYFAIVDVVNLSSKLLICGEEERDYAEKAFEITPGNGSVVHLGKRVSRKKTMIPPLDSLIKSGWRSPATSRVQSAQVTPSPSMNDFLAAA